MKKVFILSSIIFASVSQADVTLASTTSTQNSGLYEYLLPVIEKDTGIDIRVVAVGTGQALKLGENGDADLLVVHAPSREKAFVKAGNGIDRQPFMYNQFFVIGPKADLADVKHATSLEEALKKIAIAGHAGKVKFTSRGDDSGTHIKEKQLWSLAGLKPKGDWYLEAGSGMGATLNISAAMNTYTLSDSSTWLKFANKQHLTILYQDEPPLFNQYSVILIPPKKYPHIKIKEAKSIAAWLVSDKGQKLINDYKIKGKQAFIANANELTEAGADFQGKSHVDAEKHTQADK